MPRSYQPVELNTFVGGLFTEASPLTFPQNASADEENFVLNKDGSRSRRLGMDFEDNYVNVSATYGAPDDGSRTVINSFKWNNAGGDANKSIICVQIGNAVDFFDADAVPLSSGKFFTKDYGNIPVRRMSFTSVDGKLIITNGSKQIDIYEYNDNSTTLIATQTNLLIRDLFGLEDVIDGINYRVGTNISLRPTQITGIHNYNLRNQTWAVPRPLFGGDDAPRDIINWFYLHSNGVYPSNADSTIPYIYADTASEDFSKTVLRFDGENAAANAPNVAQAPIGYFIIDALDRGASRVQELNKLGQKYANSQELIFDTSQIPVDRTPTGPTCVCEYGGRVWYGGFTGDNIGGDANSPKMSSYILFSKLVKDTTDINCCYQAADPTDKDDSSLVDTDGGFIRIEGAYNISGLISLGSMLLVFADNGIWSVAGGNSYGFTATNYMTKKLTNSGCIAPGSITQVENSVYYWSRDGIYMISQNEFGDYTAQNITAKNIQKFYNSIPQTVSAYSEGVYDSYEQQVKWLYNNAPDLDDDPIELILDLNLNAWYKHRIKAFDEYPIPIKGIQTNPFSYNYQQQEVVVGGEEVDVDGDEVTVDTKIQISGTKEVVYLILTGIFQPH